ncbi:CLUMA_CG013994, isoform A [Clunio marinus]|uniref:CLUMA_CG013994, isoform A n=1 Tax=Clunio marinus TaxID=568069 RepID=A0A1J1ILW1_9DIPT|nr:CLUMA_CG013994, isoform A [Clunio marinus]
MDMELKKAFTEMQVNKIETTKKIRILDVQIDTLKKQKQRFELTSKEVDNLQGNAKVYAAVGRMFVTSTTDEIKTDLKQKQEKVEKVVESCDKSKTVLIQNLQDQEKSLRELVDTKKKESK